MRKSTRVALTLILAGLCSLNAQASESGRPVRPGPKYIDLTVATFNIKWYGLGGSLGGNAADEKRDPFLKEFIGKELATADAIVFEEIIDVDRLQNKVLSARFMCQSYLNNSPNHQKVVICWDKKYKFEPSAGEDNFTWEDVMLGRHRPAVVGTLKTAAGKTLLQIIGVHLKAMPGYSSVRVQQAKLIANHMIAQPERIPTLITGDFNTFDSDSDLIQAELDAVEDGFAEINNPADYTYRQGDLMSKFDRFWVTGSVEPISVPSVWKACNNFDPEPSPGDTANPYENISYYNKNISDHCPVQVKVRIKQ